MESLKKTGDFLSIKNNKISACLKLAELEKKWPSIVGAAMAERIAVTACEFSEDDMLITINVSSASALPAVKSRRSILIKALSRFLGVSEIKLDIRIGKVPVRSLAKEALPAYKRRTPLLISSKELEEATKSMVKEVNDPELAEEIAKIKILFEKRTARGK